MKLWTLLCCTTHLMLLWIVYPFFCPTFTWSLSLLKSHIAGVASVPEGTERLFIYLCCTWTSSVLPCTLCTGVASVFWNGTKKRDYISLGNTCNHGKKHGSEVPLVRFLSRLSSNNNATVSLTRNFLPRFVLQNCVKSSSISSHAPVNFPFIRLKMYLSSSEPSIT